MSWRLLAWAAGFTAAGVGLGQVWLRPVGAGLLVVAGGLVALAACVPEPEEA